MQIKKVRDLLVRTAALLVVCAVCTLFASIVAGAFVTHQLATLIKAKATGSDARNPAAPALTAEIDFYAATGIRQAELASFLADHARRSGFHGYPAYVTLQNDRDDYLADSRVIVKWRGGEQRLLVGSSGVIQFTLRPEKLPGLKILAPPTYTVLRQRSIPLGTAYVPEQKLDGSQLKYHVHYDGETQSTIAAELARIRTAGDVVPYLTLSDQLRRASCVLELPTYSSTELSPEEIYRLRKDAVVVIANMYADGQNSQASGVVLSPDGVIATAYHVLDKPTAVSRGVLASDGKMYPIQEVLAANKSADIALLKIDARELPAAPLSEGDVEGTLVTVISHPHSRYFSLTAGRISRYWAATIYGNVVVKMSVTADFADGSSGGPIFNSRGEVTGIVNSTAPFGDQMVERVACPGDAIRQLIQATKDETT